jgi:hypothetical protein
MKRLLFAGAAAVALPASVLAQEADSATITFGAFLDGYYAYDLGRPESGDRAFTTQAARHDEFALNLAHVEARYASAKVRGRLALQAGTSVQINYSGEPEELGGTTNFFPHVQEAVLGVNVAPSLWIDGGIMFSHIGSESWISIDNPTYTRSLPSEFAPYYSAGVRATWQATPTISAQVNVANGWQNITENNEDKAVGVRLDWSATSALTLSYANFVGREAHASTGDHDVRVFNDFVVRYAPNDRALLIFTGDVGTQEDDNWYGASLAGRWWLTPTVGINGRVERFDDENGVVSANLRATGASLGIDVQRGPAMWRTELRTLFGDDDLFEDRDGDFGFSDVNTVLVTSLSVRL